jgi:hypothetical protein
MLVRENSKSFTAHVVSGSVDEVHDVVDLAIGHFPQELGFRALPEIFGQLIQQIGGGTPQPLRILEEVGAGAGVA